MNTATKKFIKDNPALSAAEVVAALQADQRLARDIDGFQGPIQPFLFMSGILAKIDAFTAILSDDPQTMGLQLNLRRLDFVLNGKYIGSHSDPVAAGMLQQLLGIMVQMQFMTPEQRDMINGYGGGFLYDKTVTEEDVEAFRKELEDADMAAAALTAARASEATLDTRITEGNQRVQQAMNAFRTAVQEGRTDVTAPSFEELAKAFGAI